MIYKANLPTYAEDKLNQMDVVKRLLNGFYSGYRNWVDSINFDYPELSRDLGMRVSDVRDIMKDTAKRILKVTDDDIADIATELAEMYETEYAVTYAVELRYLRDKINSI